MKPMELWITRRRYRRTRFDGKARYQVGREIGGHAVVLDVDQGGLCLRVDRPLLAGQPIVIDVDAPKPDAGSIEFLGKVAWCVPTTLGYRVGVRVYEDIHDVKIALTELVCAGLKSAAGIREMRDRHFLHVEYGRRAVPASEPAQRVWKRLVPRGSWKPSGAVNLGF